MSEHVYCLRADALPPPEAAVLPLAGDLYRRIATEGRFLPRDEVETDERWRQIIPYAVLERGGEVFLVERLRAGSEARLHDLLSLGLGGHVNPPDGGAEGARDLIEGALVRELREELHIRGFFAEALGLIHQTGGVSSVHTGVLYRVKTPGEVRVRETQKLKGEFVSWDGALACFDRLEGWSQAAARYLKPELLPASGQAERPSE